MSNGCKNRIALILLFCVVVTPFCGAIYASEPEAAHASFALPETVTGAPEARIEVEPGEIPAWTEGTAEAAQLPEDRAALYVNGLRLEDCILLEGSAWVPAETLCRILCREMETVWAPETERLTVRGENFSMTLQAGEDYLTANDRCFYVPGGIQVREGEMFLPIRSLASVFSLEPVWDGESRSVSLSTEGMTLPAWADYDETDLYWLSRIIHAESGNQPLEGMMGVGNVVLNRVQSAACPDTVYGVIFDRRYGVQFSPTVTGGIYAEPNEMSIVAAKLCMEGYNVVGDSLYFLNPAIGVSSWFTRTRTYVTTIGEHVFYA